MTRPDTRLLCLVDALPFVPEDCKAWHCADCGMVTRWDEADCADCGATGGAFVMDFSAPTLRDGLPARLDAFRDFGLKVLHCDADSIESCGTEAYRLNDTRGRLVAVIATHDAGFAIGGGVASIVLNPWPDLSGLTTDDSARAVVVAALVARGASRV